MDDSYDRIDTLAHAMVAIWDESPRLWARLVSWWLLLALQRTAPDVLASMARAIGDTFSRHCVKGDA